MIDETEAKRTRNEKRTARLAEANLTIEDVLSAAKFMQASQIHPSPSFEEALEIARSTAQEYPGRSVSEIFEAGLVLLDTGWHDDASIKDAVEMAKRINAHVKIGQGALIDPAHKLFIPHEKDGDVLEGERFLAEHDKKLH